MPKGKFKIIRVTTTTDYAVEEFKNGATEINGSTIEEVEKEWFKDFPIDNHHASRDRCVVGNSVKIIKTEIMSLVKANPKAKGVIIP